MESNKTSSEVSPDIKSAQSFRKLVIVCMAASMGVGGGFLASVRGFDPILILKVDLITVMAAIGSLLFTTLFCQHALPDPGKVEIMDKAALLASKKELKRWIIIFSVAWCIAMAITAVICLKDKSSETLQDFIIGVSISIPPLGFVTWLFFRMKRFLDEDSATVKGNSKSV